MPRTHPCRVHSIGLPGTAPGAHTADDLIVALPLDYTAFCLLHQHNYLRYARARLQRPDLSEQSVADALGDLAVNWNGALCSAAPAARAWLLLGRRVARAARGPRTSQRADTLHRLLPTRQADMVVLRHRLLLDHAQTAALMGLEALTVAADLAAAHRALDHTAPTTR